VSQGPPLIVLEIVLGFAVPIGWGVWQLLELRRLKRRDEAQARAAPPAGRSPAEDGQDTS
jgi:hypothetical protein